MASISQEYTLHDHVVYRGGFAVKDVVRGHYRSQPGSYTFPPLVRPIGSQNEAIGRGPC